MSWSSVTRFGEISPLWQNFLLFWQNLDGSFCIWQSFELTLAIFYDNSQIFIVERDQILKDNLAIWSHCLEPFLTKPVLTIQLAHKLF